MGEKTKPASSRAREVPSAPSPDEQIDRIARMMVSGEWKGAASHRELAEEWGCHPRTVGDRAVAASAVVRRAGGPLEDWVLQKLAELDEIKAVAMSRKNPDCKAAAAAIKLQFEARGVFVRKTQEVPADKTDVKKLVASVLSDDDVRQEVLEQLKGAVH